MMKIKNPFKPNDYGSVNMKQTIAIIVTVVMVSLGGFWYLSEKFTEIETRLVGIDTKLGTIETKFDDF
ncbi:MAG: hypothetical protein OXF05_07465 [Hyphomicrobiales bacterium]|nr:hypothetical protein [Hyphomicrobiales bacterium]MCY4033160.1 hypothetical protein [Hyphomicrobiales bacterium]